MSLSYSCIQVIIQETGQKSLSATAHIPRDASNCRTGRSCLISAMLLNSRETQTQATRCQKQVAQGRENGESLLEKVGRKGSELLRIQRKHFGRESEDSQGVLGKKLRNWKKHSSTGHLSLNSSGLGNQCSRHTDQETWEEDDILALWPTLPSCITPQHRQPAKVLYTCVCVCVLWVFACVWFHLYVWVSLYMCAEVTGWHWESSSITFYIIHWGRQANSQLNPDHDNTTSLASQFSLGSLSLPSKHWDYRQAVMPKGTYIVCWLVLCQVDKS